MTRPLRALGALLLVLLVAAGVGGCGAPRSGRLTVVDPTALPYGMATTPPTSTGTEPPATLRSGRGPQVFFVDGTTQLRPVDVDVTGLAAPEAVRRLLGMLVQGPTAAQRDSGLATVFPPGTSLELTRLDRGTATVRVQLAVSPPAPDALPLAAGQIVLTATSVPGVEEVALLDASGPVPAPLPGGRLADGPVGAGVYRSLLTTAAPAPGRHETRTTCAARQETMTC